MRMDARVSKIFFIQIMLFFLLIVGVSLIGANLLLQNRVRNQQEQEFHHNLDKKARDINFQIMMAEEHVKALSSRSMIRLKLYQWYREEISFTELQNFTQDKYIDGATVFNNLYYAARYDDQDRMVSSFGTLPESMPLNEKTRTYFFFSNQGEYFVIINNPIYVEETFIGTDSGLFSLHSVMNNDNPYLINLKISEEAFSSERNQGKGLTASTQIGQTGYYLMAEYPMEKLKSELYKYLPVYLFLTLTFIFIVFIVSYFTILKMSLRMVRELKESGKRMLQNERFSAIGQVTAGMAHNFNNIFTGIMGYTDLLSDSKEHTAEEKEAFSSIIESCEQGAGLVKQLMIFNRPGKEELELLDLADWKNLNIMPGKRLYSSEIIIQIQNPSLKVRINRYLLKQVLENILTNAMEHESTTMIIQLDREEKPKPLECSGCKQPFNPINWVTITIKDNGKGIPENILQKITEPFHTSKSLGQGLGLAQVHGIMHQHDGHLTLRSVPGQGTDVVLYFPGVNDRSEE